MKHSFRLVVFLFFALLICHYSLGAQGQPQPLPQPQPQPSPAVRWGPIIGLVTPDSAALSWATTLSLKCQLSVNGVTYSNVVSSGTYHTISMAQLKPGTAYTGKVILLSKKGKTESAPFTFKTPLPNQKTWSFLVYGDTRTNAGDNQRVITQILKTRPQPDFFLHTGDMTENGNQPLLWDTFFKVQQALMNIAPFMACRGNHEGNAFAYWGLFYNPLSSATEKHAYYSFRYNNAEFVILDPRDDMNKQKEFLDSVLARAQQDGIPYKFVMWHNPPFSSGTHGNNQLIIDSWVPLLEKYRVTCGFFGHDHLYEHSFKAGVHYFIVGGGGAPLYQPKRAQNPWSRKVLSALHCGQVQISASGVSIKIYGTNGTILDSIDIPGR